MAAKELQETIEKGEDLFQSVLLIIGDTQIYSKFCECTEGEFPVVIASTMALMII